MERKQLRKIFNVLKKEFELDKVHTVGVCCNTCSCYQYYTEENKRVFYNKHFINGLNKREEWRNDIFYIAYNSEHLNFTEMNVIGNRFVELAKEMFNKNYYVKPAESNRDCLLLIKVGGYYDSRK